MKRSRVARISKIVLFGVLAITVFGLVVMSLWNWLMPAIFGLKAIGFWQALGLVVLCWILFGGLRGHPGSRLRMMERWEQMTPEERQKFREGLRSGCGRVEPSPPNPSA